MSARDRKLATALRVGGWLAATGSQSADAVLVSEGHRGASRDPSRYPVVRVDAAEYRAILHNEGVSVNGVPFFLVALRPKAMRDRRALSTEDRRVECSNCGRPIPADTGYSMCRDCDNQIRGAER